MNTILVTGGAGYIGSHTCMALAKAGYTCVCFDNLSSGHRHAVKWGPFVEGDIRDEHALDFVFQKYEPKAVLHFAAKAYVVESVENPSLYYDNNTIGSIRLLQAMQRHGVNKIVFSSTCATYGNPLLDFIDENHEQKPINPYGRSKLMVENILKDFEVAYGIKHVNLRYFNAAGSDFTLQTGEDHTPETHIIPSLIQTALGLRPEIQIYGQDFPTRDGTAVRDYIHVCDLADAHIKALEFLNTENRSDSFNLGTGKGSSILQAIEEVERISGKPLPKKWMPRRIGEPAYLVANCQKAEKILKFSPKYSDLPTVISSAWNWHNHLLVHREKSCLL